MRRQRNNRAQQLRLAVDALPVRTRSAMLEGIRRNRIIVGAYVDPKSGGVCPMLAAHRNGGRTDLASFARAWDNFTGAKRTRRATRREVGILRNYLELSLLRDDAEALSLAEIATQIRADRTRSAPARRRAPDTGEPHRARELRHRMRWAWLRPTRRHDDFKDLLAAAEEQLAEQRAAEHLTHREPV